MKVFITGASSGIGAALAREYHRRDPHLVIGLVARRGDALQALAGSMAGAVASIYPLDVNDRYLLAQAADDFVRRHGVPDVVIANAGISAGSSVGDAQAGAVFETIVRTNLIAMNDTFAPFMAGMRGGRCGTLVGIASVAGIRGMPGSAAYCASKAAAITYLESLRVESRGTGVRVVTIAPGFVRTPMTDRNGFRMPFLIDADVFARKAVAAIAAGRSFTVIPWPMRIVAALLRGLPNSVFDFVSARAPRKPREIA